jgi:phenylalanyl-tRNA synthetase alpha chain
MSAESARPRAPAIHALREAVTAALGDRKSALDAAELDARLARERVDVTLPAAPLPRGTVHPVSQVMDELAEIFADLGFAVATGPEIEDDWHNFTALNFPPDHPARAMHDTFYLEPREPAPSGCCCAPTLARADPHDDDAKAADPHHRTRPRLPLDSDATHTPMFHQIEGLVIDKGITLGHLKWTLETFLKAFFERDDIVLRLRPSYFPFTEPSVEVDVGYTLQKGAACWAAATIGWSCSAPAWSTPMSSPPAASIRRSGRASRSASASIGWRC